MIREPWIRVHARLIDKPVVARMCAALNLRPPAAIGHLVTLWGSVAANATNGSLRDVPDELLERWAAWSGKRGALAKWVRESHMDDDGRVNDWDDYQGPLETRREKERRRVQAWREAQRNANGTHDVTRTVTRNKTRNVAQRTGETERNGTERNKRQGKTIADSGESDTEKRSSWVAELVEVWEAKVGPLEHGRAGKQAKKLVDTHGWPVVKAALEAYLEATEIRWVRLDQFVARGTYWVEQGKLAKLPAVDPKTRMLRPGA